MGKQEKFKEKLEEWWYDLWKYNWLLSRLDTGYYNVKYGIINLFNWFLVIWKDRDWDHAYLYMILRHKLNNMSKLHREHGHSVDADNYADDIDKVVAALDRLIEDNYITDVFQHHDKKWGEFEFLTTKGGGLERVKAKTPEEKKQEGEEARILYEREHILKQQDHDFVFSMLQKHLQKWWD